MRPSKPVDFQKSVSDSEADCNRSRWLDLAPAMNDLVSQYKQPAYIANDPIQIPYRYANDPKACELVAFITALFSYGRRDVIIETISNLFRLTDQDPVGFMENFHAKRDAKLFHHFIYRFNKGSDLVFLWQRLQWVYKEYGSLEQLFMAASSSIERQADSDSSLRLAMAGFLDVLQGANIPHSYGLKFLFAHPARGGACKRINMFLRWMVRQDHLGIDASTGPVDFGLWQKALKPADLLVPLDTHVLKMNAHLGFSKRKDGSWKTAEEITNVFRLLCPEDPVKYDYALFGFSLDKRSPMELLKIQLTN